METADRNPSLIAAGAVTNRRALWSAAGRTPGLAGQREETRMIPTHPVQPAATALRPITGTRLSSSPQSRYLPHFIQAAGRDPLGLGDRQAIVFGTRRFNLNPSGALLLR